MPAKTITIDLSNEITQAEYCRRTGDTLANVAQKLKKLSVRDIPELGLRLINIAAPQFDSIRVEAPPVRDYSLNELSTLFGNLLAQFQTDGQNKEAKIHSLEKVIEELTSRLESLREELEQHKQLNELLQTDAQQKEELIRVKESHIQELIRQHQQEMDRIQQKTLLDLKTANDDLEEKEQAYQELRTDYRKVSREREALQNRLLEMSTQVVETSMTKEFQTFKEEFLLLLRALQPTPPALPAEANPATTSQEQGKTQVKK